MSAQLYALIRSYSLGIEVIFINIGYVYLPS